MMWTVVILLAAALHVESYGTYSEENLMYSRQLKINLSKSCYKLEFIPEDDPNNSILCWSKSIVRVRRGRVSGTDSDRRWYIDKVTYEDQGKYIQRDSRNKVVSTLKVVVKARVSLQKRVAGESLSISLEGLAKDDAYLYFRGPAANITLVRGGVSVEHPDYLNRVKIDNMNIEIRNVNTSDEGYYILTDDKKQKVSVTKMDLTDHHEATNRNSLLALLLLLGIPAGICCCCRKTFFKTKATTAATLQTTPDAIHPPPSGPVGPSPPYSAPGQPGTVYYHGPSAGTGPEVHPPPSSAPGQWNGPALSPGYNPAYPPTNPGYPPTNPAYPTAGPAMNVSAQPPHWNAPPPGQYPLGPVAPM